MKNKQGNVLILILVIIGLVGITVLAANGLKQIDTDTSFDDATTPTVRLTDGDDGISKTPTKTFTPPDEKNHVTPEPTVSNNNSKTDFIPFEVPVKYWTHNVEPGIKLSMEAPADSEIVLGNGVAPVLLFPDGSSLTFMFSHAAFEIALNENEIVPVDTENYENTYRYIYNNEMTYAYVQTESICDGILKDKDRKSYDPPCGAPVFHGMVITCNASDDDYSTCDEVMGTISGLEPRY